MRMNEHSPIWGFGVAPWQGNYDACLIQLICAYGMQRDSGLIKKMDFPQT
jgi:hypothetical protein